MLINRITRRDLSGEVVKTLNFVVVLLFSFLVTSCQNIEEVRFFNRFPKNTQPVTIGNKDVYLPLYDESAEQLHLFGFAPCENLQALMNITGQLIAHPQAPSLCLAAFSLSDVISSDVGNYLELSFLVPLFWEVDGQQRLGTYMHDMYLSPKADLAVEIGRQVWGYPKKKAKRINYKVSKTDKRLNLLTENNSTLIMSWKIRDNFSEVVREQAIDLITPTADFAYTVMRIFKEIDQVPFDATQDQFDLTGDFKNFADEISFTPAYWGNSFSNVVSGIE